MESRKLTYLQNRNRLTDLKDKHMDTKGEIWWGGERADELEGWD